MSEPTHLSTLIREWTASDGWKSRALGFVRGVEGDVAAHNFGRLSAYEMLGYLEALAFKSVALRPKDPSEDPLNPSEVRYDKKKVFVVHGHDQGAKEGVSRYLEKIGLTAPRAGQ